MQRLWFVESACNKVETFQSSGATQRSAKVPYFLCAFPFQSQLPYVEPERGGMWDLVACGANQ